MQPDSPLPPQSTPATEPSLLEELTALTGLFNPEIIWQEEEKIDDLDEQAELREQAAADANVESADPATSHS